MTAFSFAGLSQVDVTVTFVIAGLLAHSTADEIQFLSHFLSLSHRSLISSKGRDRTKLGIVFKRSFPPALNAVSISLSLLLSGRLLASRCFHISKIRFALILVRLLAVLIRAIYGVVDVVDRRDDYVCVCVCVCWTRVQQS